MSKPSKQVFFVTVAVRPVQLDDVKRATGAVINCWLRASSNIEAVGNARREIRELGWVPTEELSPTVVHREDYEDNNAAIEYFDQAILDGIAISIHTWNRDDDQTH
jgi:hypothetical protein